MNNRRSLLFGRHNEFRSSLENPATPLSYPAEWLLDIFNGGRTDAGIRVSEMTALQVSTVIACVNIIANGIAALPVHIYEQKYNNGRMSKIVAYEHGLYDLLAYEPNPEMNSVAFRKTVQAHALLWGNSYVEIQRDGGNRIVGLWPRNPARTRPVRAVTDFKLEGTIYPRGTMVYETYESMGDSRIMDSDTTDNEMTPRRIILAEDMFHIQGLSLDGRVGQNTIQMARQAIGLALATEKYGAKFFGNGAIPAGLLKTVGDLTPEQWEVLRRSWAEAHGGENMHKTGVLPPGVEYVKIEATPEEGQMLDARKYQRIDIASIFNVPPHMLGAIERMPKGSIEQAAIEFVLFCIGPWLAIWESEFRRKLFPKNGRSANKFLVKFDTRRLLYPDAESRSKFYAQGKNWGFLNTNDIHELEDMNPVPGDVGEAYWMPVNMQDADLVSSISSSAQDNLDSGKVTAVPPGTKHKSELVVAKPVPPPEDKAPIAPAKPKAKPKKTRGIADYVKAYEKLFRDAMGRAITRKNPKRENYLQIFVAPLASVADLMINDTLSSVPGSQPPDEREILSFVSDYVGGMLQRASLWTDKNVDGVSIAECKRAMIALLGHVRDEMAIVNLETRDDVPAFYIGRHGTTQYNQDDIYREWTDIDLDEEGIAIVRNMAEKVKELNIRRIVSSDLVRAKHSADIISEAIGVPVELDPNLRSWKHGFGGKKESEFGDQLEHFVKNPDEVPENGESLNDFRKRSQRAIDALRKQNATNGSILAVTSSSNLASYNEDDDAVYDKEAIVKPGGIVRIEQDGSKTKIYDGDEAAGQKKPS